MNIKRLIETTRAMAPSMTDAQRAEMEAALSPPVDDVLADYCEANALIYDFTGKAAKAQEWRDGLYANMPVTLVAVAYLRKQREKRDAEVMRVVDSCGGADQTNESADWNRGYIDALAAVEREMKRHFDKRDALIRGEVG